MAAAATSWSTWSTPATATGRCARRSTASSARATRRSSRSSWPGARAVRDTIPGSVSIFITPPSLDELVARLERRATDTAGEIEERVRDEPRRARRDERVRPPGGQRRRGRGGRRPDAGAGVGPGGGAAWLRSCSGVSGGIAAYKSIDTMRILQRRGHGVTVVMTKAAQRFVGPATFAALSGRPVGLDLFGRGDRPGYDHLELARGADLLLVAPGVGQHDRADGGRPGRRAAGLGPPRLRRPGRDRPGDEHAHVPPPGDGPQPGACCARAASRWSSRARACWPTARSAWGGWPTRCRSPTRSRACSTAAGTLAGRRVLVSAGGTREPIDPVRYVGNRSSGRMGWSRGRGGAPARRRGDGAELQRGPAAPPRRALRGRAHGGRPPRRRARRVPVLRRARDGGRGRRLPSRARRAPARSTRAPRGAWRSTWSRPRTSSPTSRPAAATR